MLSLECDAKVVRPLAWDLAAATLQWDGTERELSVTKVERPDEDQPMYRASVMLDYPSISFDVWVRQEGPDLKLDLLDDHGELYGIVTKQTSLDETLGGTWVRTTPRSLFTSASSISYQLNETLEVSANSDKSVQARHVVNAKMFAPGEALFRLCRSKQVSGTLEQRFQGTLDGGIAVLEAMPGAHVDGTLLACGIQQFFPYTVDAVMMLRVRNRRLIAYRTDGSEFPEEVEFQRP